MALMNNCNDQALNHKTVFLILNRVYLLAAMLLLTITGKAQQAFHILQRDTSVSAGTELTLAIDSTKLYSNFIFSAQNPQTGRWTIWHRNNTTGKYEPIYNDGMDRMNVVVSHDRQQMIYVRYKPQRPGGMYYAMLDSAWVCMSNTDGKGEHVVFTVPEHNKNAIYDLDWSYDKTRILYAYGNDEYPSLTRDGDIYEYNLATQATTNKTNEWQLWSKNCHYAGGSYEFAYSHMANFYEPLPTDIFVQRAGQPRQQMTNSTNHKEKYKYCTLTDFDGSTILYRRGLYFDNKLYSKHGEQETVLPAPPGYGGIRLEDGLYAAMDFYNNIYLFTGKAAIGTIRVSGIKTFAKDHAYNYALDCNTRLNWMGRQQAAIQWSTGERGSTVRVRPAATTTYYCTVSLNGNTYKDSITVKVAGPRPVITRNCMTLQVAGKYTAYQWLQNDVPVNGAVDTVYTPDGAGSYAVRVTDKKGRQATSAPVVITNAETDSIARQNEQLQIIPDPSTNTLKIVAPFILNMIMIDEHGKVVDKQQNVHVVKLDALPDGDYNMVLYNNSCLKIRTRKVVKM